MAFVTTPWGKTLEETNATALEYYRREPGYDISHAPPSDAPAKKQAETPPADPLVIAPPEG